MRDFIPYLMLQALGVVIMLQSASAAPADPTVAFYYGSNLPAESLSHYDRVIVQADQADPAAVAYLQGHGSRVFAYVSIGELSRAQASALDAGWQLGENPGWNTIIMDAAQPGWRQLLVEQFFRPLWERGFHSFFLDTLDSYQRVVPSQQASEAQVSGILQIIRELHRRFPGIELMLNRGFELFPEVAPLAVGLVAESLYCGWNPMEKVYVEVASTNRKWLHDKLRIVRDRYHLPVTVIDYVPPQDRELARATARRIASLGFLPWVTDSDLSTMGVGAAEVVPRRVLALYNGADQHRSRQHVDLAHSPIHRLAAVILEHLGYAVDYADVRDPLPSGQLRDKYAGIVTWFESNSIPNSMGYRDWLTRQINAGVKVAVLGFPGFVPDARLQERLSISLEPRDARGRVRLVSAARAATGFETRVKARQSLFYPLRLKDDRGQRLLTVEDEGGARMDAVFTTWWGGMAVDPYLCEQGRFGTSRWIIDPFYFFKQALKLPNIPVPDVTTQDGHRILVVHIDGDGFPSRAQMPGNDYSGKVILERILKRYPIKATVSIIEGEIGPAGKWPQLAPGLEAIAREIFALPNVEVASHSYSHPLDWMGSGKELPDGSVNGLFRYDFSLRREIDGSVAYINSRLAPKDKPTKVFLWSGAAIAPLFALAQAQSAGLLNMNGGNTIMSHRLPTLTAVSPMGRPMGPYYQVYAPIQNEDVYTNLWQGPLYGFRDVISTFQLTDSPRRLKPINVYFHFYSGSKIGSLKALKQVLNWALSQDVVSLYASDYIRKVEDFQRLTLAQRLDGCWQLRGSGQLTTLRLEPGQQSVDIGRSRGVISVRELPQGRYVSLDRTGRAVLCMRPDENLHLATNHAMNQ